MTRHYLDTSDGMADYAERHGATYDPIRGAWYVIGTIPPALCNLIINKQAERQAARPSDLQPLNVDPELVLPPQANKKRRKGTTTPKGAGPKPPLAADLRSHVEATLAVVRRHIGNDECVRRWLNTPKMALQRRTPIDAMATVEGCDQVADLARHVYD